jgi:hypothetical protein
MFLMLFACSKPAALSYLQVVDEGNLSQAALSINQPIQIKFSSRINPDIRKSAINISNSRQESVDGYSFKVIGDTLEITGELPTAANLSDATFKPGEAYLVNIKGLPSMTSVSSLDGLFLKTNVAVQVSFLKLDDDSVLSAFDATTEPLRVLNLGKQHAITVPQTQILSVRFGAAIDPRTVADSELVVARDNQQPIACPTKLVSNAMSGAELEISIPDFTGTAYIVLPSSLEGIGGRQLLRSMRQFRLRSAN